MTSRHLVTHAQLLLAGDEDLHLLDDAGFGIFAALQPQRHVLAVILELGKLRAVFADDGADLLLNRAGIDRNHVIGRRQLAQQCFGDLAVGGDDDLPCLAINYIQRNFFTQQDIRERIGQIFSQLCFALVEVIEHLLLLFAAFVGGHFGACRQVARGCFHVHHDPIGATRHRQGGITNLGGLLAKDGPQQLLFRS